MELVVITQPEFFDGEEVLVNAILDAGLQHLHLRKPSATADELAAFISNISPQWRSRIVLHSHFELAQQFCLGGIHVNMRNNIIPQDFAGSKSRSCHSLADLATSMNVYDYMFLSPIFDSISKSGYYSNFSEKEIIESHQNGLINAKVYALGGISLSNIDIVKQMGFGGAALLGDVWQHSNDKNALVNHIHKLLLAVD
jgi:thiamine-phosphate pyrophosphorylase